MSQNADVIPVNLAVEDELSETILRKLLRATGRGYHVGHVYRRGGYGYLRRTIPGWNAAAEWTPFVVLTDLDDSPCAAGKLSEWMPAEPHPNLIFRVAVREVEAWLLADVTNLASFLGVSSRHIPESPEGLTDPKAALIGAAMRSRSKEIKQRMIPRTGGTATQGPDHNGCMGEFVRTRWDPVVASERSPSLARAMRRLASFRPVWKA